MVAYTQKEQGKIRELLAQEMAMVRQLAGYGEQLQEPDLKQMCDDLKLVHQQHYTLLLRHLVGERIPLQ